MNSQKIKDTISEKETLTEQDNILHEAENTKESADSEEVTLKKKEKSGFISDFLFVFVLTIFLLVTVIMLGTKLLGYQMLTVDSGSMEPNFPKDSLIFVKAVDPSTIQKDDVITFTIDENGTLVTHRVFLAKPQERCFITKGDANDMYDGSPVSWSNVVGKVEFSLPKIGAVFRAVTAEENRIYVYIAIGVLVVLTILWFVMDAVRKKKRKKTAGAIAKEKIASTIESGDSGNE